MNLHVHLHLLTLEGLYAATDGAPSFRLAPEPTREQLDALVSRVAARARKLARQPEPAAEPVFLAPVFKLSGAPPDDASLDPQRAVERDGFNLHASAPLEANDPVALEPSAATRCEVRGPLGASRKGRAET